MSCAKRAAAGGYSCGVLRVAADGTIYWPMVEGDPKPSSRVRGHALQQRSLPFGQYRASSGRLGRSRARRAAQQRQQQPPAPWPPAGADPSLKPPWED